jgi:hypothetical protein
MQTLWFQSSSESFISFCKTVYWCQRPEIRCKHVKKPIKKRKRSPHYGDPWSRYEEHDAWSSWQQHVHLSRDWLLTWAHLLPFVKIPSQHLYHPITLIRPLDHARGRPVWYICHQIRLCSAQLLWGLDTKVTHSPCPRGHWSDMNNRFHCTNLQMATVANHILFDSGHVHN